MVFYAIHIPDRNGDDPKLSLVFESKEKAFEALKEFKSHKEARLKSFKTHNEAFKFTQNGSDEQPINTSVQQSPSSMPMNGPKSPFPGPKISDLVQFRKLIEQGNYTEIRNIITANPRYLVGSGDTPTILKEGTRYNALHVAALAKNAKITDLILETISDPKFIQLLHGKRDDKICQEVSDILLDLYLNMPEKGRQETPLHLALKFGAVEVVESLIAYPQCELTINSEGLSPMKLICSRLKDPPKELIDRIAALLDERCYVPVIRSVDNSLPPVIGEPFSKSNPPQIMADPLSPEMEILAVAGPMTKDQAQVFRKRWKTPPRTQSPSPNSQSITSPPIYQQKYNGSPFPSPISFRKNTNKSSTPLQSAQTERRGARQLFTGKSLDFTGSPDINENSASNNVIGTDVSDNFVARKNLFGPYRQQNEFVELDDSLLSPIGGSESPIQNKHPYFDTPGYQERHVKLSDTSKGLEMIGRNLAREQKVGWKEYWHFLNRFIDLATDDGLCALDEYLRNRDSTINQSDSIENNNIKPPSAGGRNVDDQFLGNLCNALSKLDVNKNDSMKMNGDMGSVKAKGSTDQSTPTSKTFGAYLCAEKSCQVFAKRMGKTLTLHLDDFWKITDLMNLEINRLQSLICSYQEDDRFMVVDFRKVHSRLANLIRCYLNEEKPGTVHKITMNVEQMLINKLKQQNQNVIVSDVTSMNHKICLLRNFVRYLNDTDLPEKKSPESISYDSECNEIWTSERNCNCVWEIELNRQSNRQFKRKAKRLNLNLIIPKASIGCDDVLTQLCGSDESDDNDVFLSDTDNSDDDVYYTPPDSPSKLIDLIVPSSSMDLYVNFILGDEPTKTDIDVMNALINIEIDPIRYPYVYRWRQIVQQFSPEQLESLHAPDVIVSNRHRAIKSPIIKQLNIYSKCSTNR